MDKAPNSNYKTVMNNLAWEYLPVRKPTASTNFCSVLSSISTSVVLNR